MKPQRHSRWHRRPIDPDPTARNAALLNAHRLIYHVARRHPHAERHPSDVEDLAQTAAMMFLQRFTLYDGEHLSTFIWFMVRNAAKALRRHHRNSSDAELTEALWALGHAVRSPEPCNQV